MNIFRILGLAVLVAGVGCAKHPQVLPDQTAPVQASLVTVNSAQIASGLTLTGVVAAQQVANISSQVMAPVTQVLVREGDHVTRGQVMVRLSSATLAAGVQQSESQVAAARKQEAAAAAQEDLAADTLARYDTLHQRHSVTPHEYEQVKTAYDAAHAQHQATAAQIQVAIAGESQSRATNSFTVIRAPFSGIVTAKYVDAGALASPGVPLLRIEDAREHEIDVQMNESTLSRLHTGATVQVALGQNSPVPARVREIVPSADAASHTFTVKISLPPSASIFSGMTASVLLPTGTETILTIPRTSVRERGQLDAVLALDSQSTAQIRYVNLGRVLGDGVEIISGLHLGDRILSVPDDALIGRRIEPRA